MKLSKKRFKGKSGMKKVVPVIPSSCGSGEVVQPLAGSREKLRRAQKRGKKPAAGGGWEKQLVLGLQLSYQGGPERRITARFES